MLLLTKTLGALIITIALAPLALFTPPRIQLLAAASVSVLVLAYPMMRAADLVPVNSIIDAAYDIQPARAQSLGTRLHNEDRLLAKTSERPVFGWGTHARSRVFSERGEDITISDGFWIIQFGTGGWMRYIGIFGLLCWPAIALFLRHRQQIDGTTALLSLVLAVKLIDYIPNDFNASLFWLIAGALIGRLEMLSRAPRGDSETVPVPAVAKLSSGRVRPGVRPPPKPAPQYARTFGRKDTEERQEKRHPPATGAHSRFAGIKPTSGYRK